MIKLNHHQHCFFLLCLWQVVSFLSPRLTIIPLPNRLRIISTKEMKKGLVPTQVIAKSKQEVGKPEKVPKAKEEDVGDEVVFIKHWESLSVFDSELNLTDEKVDQSNVKAVFEQKLCETKISPEVLIGNSANVYWRSIPMDDVRAHPNFRSLPHPDTIRIYSTKDLCLFRQDTIQWDMLHQGRLTTSKLASILGFYEKQTASFLHIPMSLQGHDRAVNAWHHLCTNRPADWTHLHTTTHPIPPPSPSSLIDKISSSSSRWQKVVGGTASFEYTYCPPPTNPSKTSSSSSRGYSTASSARLAWGSAQEATALLTAINYFSRQGVSVQEAGMSVFEAHFLSTNTTAAALLEEHKEEKEEDEVQKKRKALYVRVYDESVLKRVLPLLGASPDGLLIPSDSDSVRAAGAVWTGPIEILEIKCCSPFINTGNPPHNLRISFHTHNTPSPASTDAPARAREVIPVWHIPQLQWEIFCAGPHCTSAVLEVFSISNALFYRLPRNDTYIEMMIDLVKEFYHAYIHQVPSNRRKAPPMNFFHPSTSPKYRQFLLLTKELAQQAVKITELSNTAIQRNSLNTNFFVN